MPVSPKTMALQSSHTALDDHTQLKDSPKLGLKALTGCCDHSDISVDSNLINSLTRTLSVHSAAADCVLHRSNSSSSCSGNISSSDGALDIDPVLPWAPDTPPGTPGKLLQSISVDGSTSSSGISSPRAVTAVAADPQLQADLQSLAAASVAATPDITFGLSDHARTAFRGKRVLLISGGTRGDVQPSTALAITLSGLGATVAMATDASFKGFVQQHGLQHISLGGNARDMMALTVKWGGMLPTDMGGMFWLRGQIKEVMDSVWDAAQSFGPDLILANQLAYGQVHAAEKLDVPLHVVLTIPWVPTRAIAHPWARAYGANIVEYINTAAGALLRPCFRVLRWLGLGSKSVNRIEQGVLDWVAGTANYISTPLLDHMAWSGIADLMAAFRYKLGLTQFSRNNLGSALYRYPTTCLFSSHLVPRPADWGHHVHLSGFLSLDDAIKRCNSSSRRSTNVTINITAEDLEVTSSTQSRLSSAALDLPGRTTPPCLGNSSTDNCSSGLAGMPKGRVALTAAAPWQPPQELTDFLAAGPAPLYIGFGSMVVQDAHKLMQTVLAAVRQLPQDHRVIVCSGWAGIGAGSNDSNTLSSNVLTSSSCDHCSNTSLPLSGSDSSNGTDSSNGSSFSDDERVLFIQEAPHDWLFPRCSALLHHGGVGTTAVGLRHAKPTLVISAFGDLFFWGEVCHQLGVGPEAIPLDDLTSQILADRLSDLVSNEGYKKAAKVVAEQLVSEDGLVQAVESIAASL